MFELSTRAEYGARALIDLAEHYGQAPVALSHIASRQNVSFKYLEQLMVPLRKNGLVRAVRGKNGGYVLTRAPGKISIADIVGALEGPVRIFDCAPYKHDCKFSGQCLLKYVWREMEKALDDVMANRTLADLLPRLAATPVKTVHAAVKQNRKQRVDGVNNGAGHRAVPVSRRTASFAARRRLGNEGRV